MKLTKVAFPDGGVGPHQEKNFHGRGIDNLENNTIQIVYECKENISRRKIFPHLTNGC